MQSEKWAWSMTFRDFLDNHEEQCNCKKKEGVANKLSSLF